MLPVQREEQQDDITKEAMRGVVSTAVHDNEWRRGQVLLELLLLHLHVNCV